MSTQKQRKQQIHSFLITQSLRIIQRKGGLRRRGLRSRCRRNRVLLGDQGQFGHIRDQTKVLEHGLLFAVTRFGVILFVVIDDGADSADTDTLALSLNILQ